MFFLFRRTGLRTAAGLEAVGDEDFGDLSGAADGGCSDASLPSAAASFLGEPGATSTRLVELPQPMVTENLSIGQRRKQLFDGLHQ